MFMRRQWRRILYACTPTILKIEPRDVTVTSPHRALTCLAGYGDSKQAISRAADQHNRTNRPERSRRHPAATPVPNHLTRTPFSSQRIPSLAVAFAK